MKVGIDDVRSGVRGVNGYYNQLEVSPVSPIIENSSFPMDSNEENGAIKKFPDLYSLVRLAVVSVDDCVGRR